MNNLKNLLIIATLAAGAAYAQTAVKPVDAPMAMDNKKPMAASAVDMTEAEVRKVDMDNKKSR